MCYTQHKRRFEFQETYFTATQIPALESANLLLLGSGIAVLGQIALS